MERGNGTKKPQPWPRRRGCHLPVAVPAKRALHPSSHCELRGGFPALLPSVLWVLQGWFLTWLIGLVKSRLLPSFPPCSPPPPVPSEPCQGCGWVMGSGAFLSPRCTAQPGADRELEPLEPEHPLWQEGHPNIPKARGWCVGADAEVHTQKVVMLLLQFLGTERVCVSHGVSSAHPKKQPRGRTTQGGSCCSEDDSSSFHPEVNSLCLRLH